jgi:hypothetical protein
MLIRRRLVSGACILLALNLIGLTSEAQADLRSTFPGRRVGGGTRGECSARTLVHLVPENSVFSPEAQGVLALVQGPTANPVDINITFRLENEGEDMEKLQTLPATSASIIVIDNINIVAPTIWESSFNCESTKEIDDLDPMSFVQSTSPPVVSLLLLDAEPIDRKTRLDLKALRLQCDASVSTSEIMDKFGLADLVSENWPIQLPIHCFSHQ